MIRTFLHTFAPVSASPITGPSAELTTNEIEDAGIREVLQTPGATLGSWTILDSLLEPTGPGSPFMFREPLGQAREVKVALSGLFGRFVARAYLEHYLGLSIFAHLGQLVLRLDGRRGIEVRRKSRGDLPDWVACNSQLRRITIAEAKGCHDRQGPSNALARAWVQANRIDIRLKGRKAAVKRVAIATRWGATLGGATTPLMAVRDPDESGELTPEELGAAAVGLTRLHVANLLKALGHAALATSLQTMATSRNGPAVREAGQAALDAIRTASLHDVNGSSRAFGPTDGLLGAWVSRGGPMNERALSKLDQETLQRLELRPVFVGVQRDLVNAAVVGDAEAIGSLMDRERTTEGPVRSDGAAIWMIRPTDGTVIH